MDQNYERSEDLHIRKTYIYKKTGDVYAYADSAYTTKISAETLMNLCQKGMLLVKDGAAFHSPFMSGWSSETAAYIVYAGTDAIPPTAVTLTALHSEEYVAE